MKTRHWLLFLSIIGSAFSGYLTMSKLFFQGCPFDSACPYFLGYPACMYGFGMFLTLGVVSLLMVMSTDVERRHKLLKWFTIIAGLGVAFGGYFSMKELFFPDCPYGKCVYRLGIPSCVYGWLVFCISFTIALVTQLKARRN